MRHTEQEGGGEEEVMATGRGAIVYRKSEMIEYDQSPPDIQSNKCKNNMPTVQQLPNED